MKVVEILTHKTKPPLNIGKIFKNYVTMLCSITQTLKKSFTLHCKIENLLLMFRKKQSGISIKKKFYYYFNYITSNLL